MPLYVPLDVNWPDDESVIAVGLDGAGLHAIIMAVGKRLPDDGWIGRRTLTRYGATDELINRLATASPSPLIEQREDGAVRSVGYHKRNPSKAALEAQRAAKKVAGIKGNHSRWHSGDFEDCEACKAQVIAQCDTGAIAGDSLTETDAIAIVKGKDDATRTSSQPAPVAETPSRLPVEIAAPLISDARSHLRPVADNDTDAGGMGAGQADTHDQAVTL